MRNCAAPAAIVLALVGCAAPQAVSPTWDPEATLAARPRVLWIAAHGDDEALTGGLLAKACVHDRLPCHFLVMNRDAGAECALEDGCKPKITEVRHREMVHATRLYEATLEQYDFFNAPLPVESFPTRQKLEQIWMKEGDPAGLIARSVRRFRPDVVVTLDPYHGFTDHPEHGATARFALAGIRLAAASQGESSLFRDEPAHRVGTVWQVQNKYWFMKLSGDAPDPMPFDATFDPLQPCDVTREGRARSCRDVRDDASNMHRSQASDMGGVRAVAAFWSEVYLRRMDPFGSEASTLVAELGNGARGWTQPPP